MLVTTQGEYGLRCLLAIASSDPEQPVSITDIIELEQLPRAYVEQLVFRLRRAGLVLSLRGTKGGYRLARSPEEISVKDVLDVLENNWSTVFCERHENRKLLPCPHNSSCPVSSLWTEVRDMVVAKLESTSLSDLLAKGFQPGGPAVQVGM